MRLHVLYLSVPRLHAMIDDDGRLMHLYRVPGGRIANGAIVARTMTEGMLSPGFDGEVLALDAFGMLRVIDYLDRTARTGTSDASKARRMRTLVQSAGFRGEMLAALRRFNRGGHEHTTGEQAVFDGYVLAQLRAAYLRYWMMPVEHGAAERGARLVEGIATEFQKA